MSVSLPAMARISEAIGMVEVCTTLSAMEDTERPFDVMVATDNGTGKN